MQVLGILFPLIGLVSLVAWVWLVVVAFKRSVGWGIAVLLLSPIAPVVFAVKYWQESKKPFLICVGSMTASLAMVVVMLTFLGGFAMTNMAKQMSEGEVGEAEVAAFMEQQVDRVEPAGELTPEKREEPARSADGPATQPIQWAVETPEPEPVETASVRKQRDIVPLSDVAKHVGKILRVVGEDGRTFRGRLVADDGDELIFEKSFSSGTMAVSWKKSEILSLHKIRPRSEP
jgi:hypothetical protein